MVSKKINYVSDALPPASSICFFASAASLQDLLEPLFGADSTNSFASFNN
jgi:hypothetical protein